MAQLTPLAKGLVTIAVIGATASAAWHLGLKNKFGKHVEKTKTAVTTKINYDAKSEIGSKNNPLRVSIVSFHGYVPGLVANGNSLITRPSSVYGEQNLNLEFKIQDDIPTLSTIFESGAAHCAWRTSDFWAQEHPNLRNAGGDGKAVMIVDNTQGGDAVIAKDPSIKAIEDLAGKTVALLQYTPSHGMLIDAIENSSLSSRKKESIKLVFINAEEGTAGVRAAFESGKVDAAVIWDPDLALAKRAVSGAHVIYSTKTATNLIYDVMVCDAKVLAKPDGKAAIQKFVSGWMTGVKKARADKDNAVNALVETEEFFKLLADKEGKPFIKELFSNIVWTGLEDNARILGMSGSTNHYERVYKRFDEIYRKAGALANPKSPVITPQDSFDYTFIKSLLSGDTQAIQKASQTQENFSQTERAKATSKTAMVTKPVIVSFSTGSSELSKRSQKVIDEEMVPFIENNGKAYFEISGNTDSVGSRGSNMTLSNARSKAVVDYLVKQWEFQRERFKVTGYGPDKPLCDEINYHSEGLSLEDCRAANRTTRIAVYGK